MLRRLLASALGFILVLALFGCMARDRARSAHRPDVVIVAIDTLRADHLHCCGDDWIRTPPLDALAGDGDRFTTLAEHLAGAGYRTYGVASVKWLTIPFGTAQGFNFELPLASPPKLEGGPW
ncbi:MAG: hypothetical protein IPK64_00855 [bacterium]|nr:hypothetical protein [bacterium]